MTGRPLPGREPEAIEIALLGGIAVVLLILIVWIATASLALHLAPCDPASPKSQWPGAVTVSVALLFFGLGRLAAYWREPGDEPAQLIDETARKQRVLKAAIVQGAFTGFLLLTAVLLTYETLSLSNFDRFWPITLYVRCANEIAALPTVAAACVLSFLLGHWLWFPERRK
jgi:hypothetical protein